MADRPDLVVVHAPQHGAVRRSGRGRVTAAIVLTGARAPATLDLARRFADEGYRVIVADSEPTATARSRAVHKAYRVPSARFEPREFARAVAGIADRHAAQLVVPTCEEIFWLAAVADEAHEVGEARLTRLRDILFAPSLSTLRRLHDKGEFVEVLGELGIARPETEVMESAVAWRHRSRARERRGAPAVVVKPAFSRFGTRTRVVAPDAPLPSVGRVTRAERWLVQERIEGEEFCTFAVAVDGALTAFVAYRPVWRAGSGAGVAFDRLAPDALPAVAAREICERIASSMRLTGQFGLDLMQTATDVVVLECNPRLTSGVHLFAPPDGLAAAYADAFEAAARGTAARPSTRDVVLERAGSARPVAEASRASARLALPHALYAPAGMRAPRDVVRFVRQLSAPDALRPPADRIPVGALVRSVGVRAAVARRAGRDLLGGSTYDIEWNGEPLPRSTPPPAGGGAAAALVSELERVGLSAAVENVDSDLTVLATACLGAHELPLTISHAATPPPTVRGVTPMPAAQGAGTPQNTHGVASAPAESGAARPSAAQADTSPPAPDGGSPHPSAAGGATPHRSGPTPQSYVVSPVSHYVLYAREELGEIRSPSMRRAASALITGLGLVLRWSRADDVVFVGNALVSTNLLPELPLSDVQRLTRTLVSQHPCAAIGWRSVHGRGSNSPEVLRRAGYRLIPSRSILFTSTRGTDWLRPRDTMRDRRLLEASGYRVVAAVIDPATGRSDAATRDRIAELYRMLYLDKYSLLNPAYTAEFIGAAQAAGLLRFVLLVRDGRIDGAFGYSLVDGLLAAPVLGYDTAMPAEIGLYRMLSYLIARTAHEHDSDVHGSSGVADFKRNRGAENEVEFTAVFVRHLPLRRRLGWWLLQLVVNAIALPLIRRDGF
ncbi:MAG: ATP-grasp domain-containing protein [Herbiconiux sp.]|nr:MAG: ATP-grasp domain-containing protein [Herbiconiux sp.]